MDTGKGVLNTGSIGGNRGGTGWGSWGGIAWGEMPYVGEGEEGSKTHCHVCTYATILHVLHIHPCPYKRHEFIIFDCCIIFHGVYVPHFPNPVCNRHPTIHCITINYHPALPVNSPFHYPFYFGTLMLSYDTDQTP